MATGMLAPITRTRRTRRTNRAFTGLLGVLALAAGVAGILAFAGAFGRSVADGPVFTARTRSFVHDSTWFWFVAGAAAIIVAFVGLWWLLIQARVSIFGDIQVETDRNDGETVLDSGAVTDALCEQIEGFHGVESASASLLGDPAEPMVALDVWLDGRAELAEVRAKVESRALVDLEHALDWTEVPIRVEYRLGTRKVRSVR